MADSLAVRHRPRRFSDVAGQRHVSAVLRSAAARQSPPQQILLAGGSGLGKTTLARIFAAALFCADRTDDGDACGMCESCCDVTGAAGFHPDVIELDAASNGGKDEIRDIAARASLAPMRAAWKLYIIDEAHGLTGPGGQAFLKLLEEPPAHTVFVLATTDPDKLPTAVRGRCSILEVLAPTEDEVAANLRRIAALEGWSLDDDAVVAVVAATDPALGMRGTVMTLEKLTGPLAAGADLSADDLEDLLGTVSPSRLRRLTDAILAGDRAEALLAVTEQIDKVGGSHLRRQLTAWARGELAAAARTRTGFEAAWHRYELLATAGTYEGALEVAVARMATPALDESPQAVRALLESAQQTLTALAAHRDMTTSDPPAAAGAEASTVSATPVSAVPQPSPRPTGPAAAAPANAPAVPAGIAETPLTPADADLRTLLNAVGRSSARAAAVLRHCAVARAADGTLSVTVPATHAQRAADVALTDVLAALDGDTDLPRVALPLR